MAPEPGATGAPAPGRLHPISLTTLSMAVRIRTFLAVPFLLLASATAAAAPACVAPQVLDDPAYDVTPAQEKNACLRKPVRKAADFHMLVLSWSPSFCRSAGPQGNTPRHLAFQCRDNSFGWVVHGLWAELEDPESCDQAGRIIPLHPRYCRGDLPPLPEPLVKANMCMMPGSRLIQGEWEKHGACIFNEPSAYFAKIRELRGQLVLPGEMMPQSQLFRWMRANNPILRDVRMDYSPGGKELRICYSTAWKPISCPQQGARPGRSQRSR